MCFIATQESSEGEWHRSKMRANTGWNGGGLKGRQGISLIIWLRFGNQLFAGVEKEWCKAKLLLVLVGSHRVGWVMVILGAFLKQIPCGY